MKIWVNGRRSTTVSAADRGLQYGDGLFETMCVRQHGIRLLDFHLERLEEGCRRLKIEVPDVGKLRQELDKTVASTAAGVLKLIVTRGVGPRGYRPSGVHRATRIVTLQPPSQSVAEFAASGVQIRLCKMRLGLNAALAGLKTLNRLESVLARAEWNDGRIWEGLMRDTEGNVICGTMSNVFMRHGSFLMTPMLDRCGIAGVMRRWVLQQAQTSQLRPIEGRMNWDDLEHADEIFLTNAVCGVVSVAALKDGAKRIRILEHDTAHTLRARLAAL